MKRRTLLQSAGALGSSGAIKDFTPVGMIGGTPHVRVVNAALPAMSNA
jgi:hypothetical protein